MTGCKIYSYPSNYQPKFDDSESIMYNCQHNSEKIDEYCSADKAK